MKYLRFLLPAFVCLGAFTSCAQKVKAPKKVKQAVNTQDLSKLSQATFAAGCFWHEEALFESVKGVKEAVSGYAGGTTNDPTYESIETGNTGHTETVTVYYDSSVINYPTLLKVFFAGQDPTDVNGQGPDRGTQYRSVAFYNNVAEKNMIDNLIKTLNASGKYKRPIAVQVAPLKKFWPAEDYHQDYIMHNPDGGYVRNVSIPEIQHFQHKYPDLVKADHKF
ncbi:MAG: peptide-methionine (S)-S-oxide reductase MsrA [Ginsengibacter sp.]